MKELLLITPPFTQLNTPYPATAYLKGFLNTLGITSCQMDLGLEVVLEIFSKEGLQQLFDYAAKNIGEASQNSQRIFSNKEEYIKTIEGVVSFLQDQNPDLAAQIETLTYLPVASRLDASFLDVFRIFSVMDTEQHAKHLATLYLEDLSDFIVDFVDPHFGFSRYAESLGRCANSFNELSDILQADPSFIDRIACQILDARIREVTPKLLCFSVPFPGNLYSAFRCAQYVKAHFPEIKIAMGGGFPNTELRNLKEPRVFDFFDFITLDDGERPLELLIKHLSESDAPQAKQLKRTFMRVNGEVVYLNDSPLPDYKQNALGTPDYSDFRFDRYISVIEMANPMHSLWTDGQWLKLTMAHGCYWGKCTFCDVSLDYIKLYEPLTAKLLVDRMETLIAQTGLRNFHFVDEAAPPALMGALASEIIRRKLKVAWWTNIRFEKSFSPGLCQLLEVSGCIAVSGGLEVASDRLLALIKKGVTVAQVANVTHNFRKAGIMVHAYLMYGYPSQTVQETIDSLEMVRQMFDYGLLDSGFWHRFALTAHSPIGFDPAAYNIVAENPVVTFAHNDIEFVDKTGIDHSRFSFGLEKSMYNFINGFCLDHPLKKWFDFPIPKTSIPQDYIKQVILNKETFKLQPNAKVYWISRLEDVQPIVKSKKGRHYDGLKIDFRTRYGTEQVMLETGPGQWLADWLPRLSLENPKTYTLAALKADYENHFEHFELFWFSKPVSTIRNNGLISL